jgi:hypothetical protein
MLSVVKLINMLNIVKLRVMLSVVKLINMLSVVKLSVMLSVVNDPTVTKKKEFYNNDTRGFPVSSPLKLMREWQVAMAWTKTES